MWKRQTQAVAPGWVCEGGDPGKKEAQRPPQGQPPLPDSPSVPITPDHELPQCLPSLLLSGEVNPEALLGAQAAERGVYGSPRPSLASIPRTQVPGVWGGMGAGSTGPREGGSQGRDPC